MGNYKAADTDIKLMGKGTWLQSFYDDRRKNFTAAVWKYGHPERWVFGLKLDNNPTHMCYLLDEYFVPKEVIAYPQSSEFYFDAGSNGREIFCSYKELTRVFRKLGLIND